MSDKVLQFRVRLGIEDDSIELKDLIEEFEDEFDAFMLDRFRDRLISLGGNMIIVDEECK